MDPDGLIPGSNAREFVGNDPANATDPTGLYAQYWWQDLGETYGILFGRPPQPVAQKLQDLQDANRDAYNALQKLGSAAQQTGQEIQAGVVDTLNKVPPPTPEEEAKYDEQMWQNVRSICNPVWKIGPRNPNAVGQPGFWEGTIPVWGNGRAAIDNFQNGEYISGAVHTALAISDVFLVKALVTGALKVGAEEAVQVGSRALEEEGCQGS